MLFSFTIHYLRKPILIRVISLCVTTLLVLLKAWMIGNIFRILEEMKFRSKALEFIAFFLLLLIIEHCCQNFFKIAFEHSLCLGEQQLKEKLLQYIIDSKETADYHFELANILTVFQKDLSQVVSYCTDSVPYLFQAIIGLIIYAIYFILIRGWIPLLSIIIIGLLQFIPPLITNRFLVKNYKQAAILEEHMAQHVLSGITGFSTLKLLNLHEWFMERYKTIQEQYKHAGTLGAVTSAIQSSMQYIIKFLQQTGLALLLGAYVLYNYVTLELALQSYTLSGTIYTYLGYVFRFYNDYKISVAAVERLNTAISALSDASHHSLFHFDPTLEYAASVKGITCSIKNGAQLNGIAFDIQNTGVHILRGANGVGKTTLLRILAGEIIPSAGAIICNGRGHVNSMEDDEQFIFCPQNPPHLQMLGIDLINMLEDDWRRDFYKYFFEFELDLSCLNNSIHGLSGGERKCLFLSICLAAHGEILLLDEPESSLDFDAALKLKNILTHYSKPVLLISHSDLFSDISVKEWTLRNGSLFTNS